MKASKIQSFHVISYLASSFSSSFPSVHFNFCVPVRFQQYSNRQNKTGEIFKAEESVLELEATGCKETELHYFSTSCICFQPRSRNGNVYTGMTGLQFCGRQTLHWGLAALSKCQTWAHQPPFFFVLYWFGLCFFVCLVFFWALGPLHANFLESSAAS